MSRTKQTRRVACSATLVLLSMALWGCSAAAPESCPALGRIDLSDIDATDASLPFHYPLDVVEDRPHDADFCEHRGTSKGMFHAAEDFWRPAGTEVHAMADGAVSFSGRMDGYGWLVIVDHPDMNLYSLYGHLSPSRWHADPGPVAKGDLIGHLGDEWENGGSRDQPLVAHLHLGVRVGQRTDYPGRGEWRWMAGWITSCPAELGWVQPSALMAGQQVPAGGFTGPVGGILERWWTEILFIGAFLLGAASWTIVGARKRRPLVVLAVAVVYAFLARYLTSRGFVILLPLQVASAIALLTAVAMVVRGDTRQSRGRAPSR